MNNIFSIRSPYDKQIRIDIQVKDMNEIFKHLAKDIDYFKDFLMVDINKEDQIKELIRKYEKNIDDILKKKKKKTLADKELSEFIINFIYAKNVTAPHSLNNKAFSSAYGETSLDLIHDIFKNIEIKNKDIFVDLGSGIGQLVMYISTFKTFRKCIGIENQNTPASYATNMLVDFENLMTFFNKCYSKIELIHGDILNKEYHSLIVNASFVFVNNLVFNPDLNLKLENIFIDLKKHSLIVSTKPFKSRRKDQIKQSLMSRRIGKLTEFRQKVSWTCNLVPFYVQEINVNKEKKRKDEIKMILEKENKIKRVFRSTESNEVVVVRRNKSKRTPISTQNVLNSNRKFYAKSKEKKILRNKRLETYRKIK